MSIPRVPHPLPARPPSPDVFDAAPSQSQVLSATAARTSPQRRDDSHPPPRRLLDAFFREHKTLSELLPFEVVQSVEDSRAYTSFLATTLVATCAPDLDDDAPWHALQRVNPNELGKEVVGMRDVLAQVHTRLFAQHAKKLVRLRLTPGAWISNVPKHVLCFGYRPANVYKSDAVRSGESARVVNEYVNTIVGSLSISKEWLTLLRRVGSNTMINLLSSPELAVFTLLPNGCLMQLSGTPVSELRPLASGTTSTEGAPKKKRRTAVTGERAMPTTNVEDSQAMDVDEPDESIPQPAIRPKLLGPFISAPQLARTTSSVSKHAAPLRFTTSHMIMEELPVSQTDDATKHTQVEGSTRPSKRRKILTLNSPSEILISRGRLYHSRPNKYPNGKLIYGLPTKHVFSRVSSMFSTPTRTNGDTGRALGAARHLAKYVFPRQFGLHNAFTWPKPRLNYDIGPDYQDREIEIKKFGPIKTPTRVKPVLSMLERMTLLHSRCRYRKLLDRCCPKKVTKEADLSQADREAFLDLMSQPKTQVSHGDTSILDDSFDTSCTPIRAHGASQARVKVTAKPRFTEFMCSSHEVIGYVTTVVREMIPRDFWGSTSNEKVIVRYVSEFLRLRRFESMSVHTLMQGLCIADCDWLLPPSSGRPKNRDQRATAAEMNKRRELLMEWLHWFFDGFLVDLVRTVFYVTDSATHDKKAIFFRHDDWASLCAPSLIAIKQTMFDAIPDDEAQALLKDRELGFSFVRLLPKATGFRPIVNLARKPLVTGPFGRKELGKTINKVLQASFDVLTFERKRKPNLVGSLVSSPMDILEKLKAYKAKMTVNGTREMPALYFVKLDVQAAYDTIKQEKLLRIVDQVLSESDYAIQKYSQVTVQSRKPYRRWQRRACAEDDQGQFEHLAREVADEIHDGILTDQVVYQSVTRPEVMKLLREHITMNLVKFGSHFFKQNDGIPQGSVLSSLLCSLFYGDMERTQLNFTNDANSLLLRYVDDFLFITTKKPLAARFLRVMNQGLPEYGCKISPEKRLTNFDIALHPGEVVPPFRDHNFPWCGHTIHTSSLDVRADTSRSTESDITNKLTVQRHSKPGESFLNSMMLQIKVRSYLLYLDTSHNSLHTVLLNIYQSMCIVAIKFDAYVREWRDARTRDRQDFFLNVVRSSIGYEVSLIRHRSNSNKAAKVGARCRVAKKVVEGLSTQAFLHVLSYRANVWSSILPELIADLRLLPLSTTERDLIDSIRTDPSNAFVEKTLHKTRRAYLR